MQAVFRTVVLLHLTLLSSLTSLFAETHAMFENGVESPPASPMLRAVDAAPGLPPGGGDKILLDDVKQEDEPLPVPVAIFEGAKREQFDFFLEENGNFGDVFSFTGDGVLKIAGKPSGWIGTKKTYKNFRLTVEYRWPENGEPADGGIFVRLNESPVDTVEPANDGHFPYRLKAFEVQLQYGNAGDLIGHAGMKFSGESDRYLENLGHRSGELRSIKKYQGHEKPVVEKGPGQWNSLSVFCFEELIVVRLNGRIVNWAFSADPVPGKIGFLSEGGPIEFRNAFLVEEK